MRTSVQASYVSVAGLILPEDPQALVEGYAEAIAQRDVQLAARICRAAARLGHQYLATCARCGEALNEYDEARYDALRAEDDAAEANLAILQAVPAFRAGMEALPTSERAAIWAKYAPLPNE